MLENRSIFCAEEVLFLPRTRTLCGQNKRVRRPFQHHMPLPETYAAEASLASAPGLEKNMIDDVLHLLCNIGSRLLAHHGGTPYTTQYRQEQNF